MYLHLRFISRKCGIKAEAEAIEVPVRQRMLSCNKQLFTQQVVLKEGYSVLRSGGNSWWQAMHTKPEPHAMQLNGELVLVRLSDGAIIDRIAKPTSLAV
jgi:hypothetical protein